MSNFQVAIIGAGPAGLSAALTLSRSLQSTVVFDSPTAPRNAASPAIAGCLGRDLEAPAAFKQTALQEIDRYGFAELRQEEIMRLVVTGSGAFALTGSDGSTLQVTQLLLACGMLDRLPDFAGLSDFWGQSVINCPFCHGYELAKRPWGVFVNRPAMLEVAEIYQTWSDDLMLFLDSDMEVTPQRRAALEAKGIAIEERPIARLLGKGSSLQAIELADGVQVEREALVVWPFQSQTQLVTSLDLALDDDGCLQVDAGFRTTISGLYAAGDLIYAGHQNVNTAIHMGAMAAATMVLDRAIS